MTNTHKKPSKNKLIILLILGILSLLIVLLDVFLTKDVVYFRDSRIYTGRIFPSFSTDDGNSIYSYQNQKVRISVHEYDEYPSHYFVADVWVRNPNYFLSAFSGNEFNTSDDSALTIAANHNALLAVNSDFNWGLVIRNGELYSTEAWDLPMLVMYKNGSMKINYNQLYTAPEDLLASGALNTWTFGPVLVDNYVRTVSEEEDDSYHPRTALGYYSPKHYCFVVVDGRQSDYSSGMLLSDLGDLMVSLGCKIAYNFDGGASSQMVANGNYLNRPCPSMNSERLQRNMIVITDSSQETSRQSG